MKTVLVADEDSRVRNIVRLLFTEDRGYRVVSTSSGVEAVLKAKEVEPDIVLADVSLSDKDGYEVCKEIKSDLFLRNTPVLLLSSGFAALNEEKALEAGADDIVIKPFEAARLEGKVERIISKEKPTEGGGELMGNAIEPSGGLNEKKDITSVSVPLLLLVTLMIMAPILYRRVNTRLPKAESNPLPTASEPMPAAYEGERVVITVSDNREISIKKRKYALSELKAEIPHLIRGYGREVEDEYVFLRVDPEVPYGVVMEVAAEVKRAGVKKVEFITEPVLVFEMEPPDLRKVSRKGEIKDSQPEKGGGPVKVTAKEGEPVKNNRAVLSTTRPEGTYVVQTGVFQGEEKAQKIAENLVSEGQEPLTKASVVLKDGQKKKEQSPQGSEQVNPPKAVTQKASEKKKEPAKKVAYGVVKLQTNVKGKALKPSKTPKEGLKGNRYFVKRGDSLWKIANRFNTTVKDLKVANGLRGDRILIGQVLVIHGVEEPKGDSKVALKKKSPNGIKITGSSFYMPLSGVAVHSFIVENIDDTAYKDIKVRVRYYSRVGTEVTTKTMVLPFVLPPKDKKIYTKEGAFMEMASSGAYGSSNVYSAKVELLEATPVAGEMDKAKLNAKESP